MQLYRERTSENGGEFGRGIFAGFGELGVGVGGNSVGALNSVESKDLIGDDTRVDFVARAVEAGDDTRVDVRVDRGKCTLVAVGFTADGTRVEVRVDTGERTVVGRDLAGRAVKCGDTAGGGNGGKPGTGATDTGSNRPAATVGPGRKPGGGWLRPLPPAHPPLGQHAHIVKVMSITGTKRATKITPTRSLSSMAAAGGYDQAETIDDERERELKLTCSSV